MKATIHKPSFSKRKNRYVITYVEKNTIKSKTFLYKKEADEFYEKYLIEYQASDKTIKSIEDILAERSFNPLEVERKCDSCCQILPVESFRLGERFCKKCKTRVKRKKQLEKIQRNLCRYQHCEHKNLSHSQSCYYHWFADTSTRHFRTRKYTQALIDLYENQKRKCVYSDKDLNTKNMSLDHRTSRYDDKSLIDDISNVQWVHKDINGMKSKFSHESFLNICLYIVIKHFGSILIPHIKRLNRKANSIMLSLMMFINYFLLYKFI